MADAQRLTLAYLSAHPADAARVLERMPVTESGALFARIPARAAAPVLSAMLPTAAARNLGALGDDASMALLASLGAQPAVLILRHVAEPRRTRLLEGLPTATAVASRLLLGYSEETVGAWADPDVTALVAQARVEDALERLRNGADGPVECVHVIDADERLIGTVEIAALLRAPASAQLGGLALQRPPVIAASTPLAGALEHRGWERHAALPVVERSERLIGVLRRFALMRALAQKRTVPGERHEADDLSVAFARGYWNAVSGLFAATLTVLPRVPALRKSGDEP
jgi:magnesium transporter